MKVLLISDIHANFESLKALIPYILQSDVTINLGDIVGYSCQVNECIEFLQDKKVISIQGNHERYLIEGLDNQKRCLNEAVKFGIREAKRVITYDNLEWVKSLPLSLILEIGGRTFACFHGSPFDTVNEYVFENNTDFTKWNVFTYNFIAIGHTHRELLVRTDNSIVINPGSVGQSRDYEGKVCASLIDTDNLNVERIRVPYNWKYNLAISTSRGAREEWLYKHFKTLIKY